MRGTDAALEGLNECSLLLEKSVRDLRMLQRYGFL
jgi:hypothetical protein